jgi:hypothetical protein
MIRLRFVLASVALAFVAVRAGVSREKAAPKDLGSSAVQDALRAEAAGALDARDEKLQSALRVDPASRDARWQSGMIERDGRWIRFDAIQDEPTDAALLEQYRQRREKAQVTRKDQLELANWCKKQRLFDRERAHLIAALDLSPNGTDPVLCERVGLKLIDGAWMSDDEIRADQREQSVARRDLKKWQPVVERLSARLEAQSEKARKQARQDLEQLNDPTVLPALETVLAPASLEKARLLVELLGRYQTVKASEPLARLAVTSEWNVVRKEAAAKLRARPVGSYAPQLLAALRTPIDSKINLFVGADGVHVAQQLKSETQSTAQHYERQFALNVQYVVEPIPNVLPTNVRQGYIKNRKSRAAQEVGIIGEQIADRAQLEVDGYNEPIRRVNDRVCGALAEATGLSLPAEPEAWWEWWRNYNQLSQSSKRREYESESTTETMVVETIRPISCLVAGSPVRTDRGSVPVEEVKVGDLVLSKDPVSGELSYQAVLRTTVRDPEPVWKATTDRGEIRGTGGHNFWVSGRGWTMLRDIKPNDRLHGAAQPATVREVTSDGAEKTYNLVVADFHTYFVGNDVILSHDVTFAKPLDATVPGMRTE